MSLEQIIPRPVDRSATNPVYILVAVDPSVKEKVQYYQVEKFDDQGTHIDIKGHLLTKAQADKLREKTSTKNDLGMEINRKIPWVNVVRLENTTYVSKKKRIEEV